MTEFEAGYGPEFDGNSILLHMFQKRYVFIGASIFTFQALHSVVEFNSPVGNNDVPYPHAIDEKGYVYLMIENIVLAPTKELKKYMEDKKHDPYFYYYDNALMTIDHGMIPPKHPVSNTEDIKEFYIGNNQYTMTYSPHPSAEYKRLMKFDGAEEHGIYIIKNDGTKVHLTQHMYVDLMTRFGKMRGFLKFMTLSIHDRL